jgi:predicted permease
MRWIYTLPLRLRSLFGRPAIEQELDEELRYHLDRQTEANVAAGMSETEARRAARQALDGITRIKEECRDAMGWRLLDTLRREGKQTIRRLVHDWRFSAGAVLILGIGIGANTAIFSFINNLLFEPHPFADSGRLVNVYQNDAVSGDAVGSSFPAFLDIRRRTDIFTGASALLTQEGRYQHAGVKSGIFEYTTAAHLDVLGLRPLLGRWFTAEEEHANAPVAVLGHSTWVRDFHSDASVIGQTIRVGAKQFQLIGVGPAELNGSQGNALFTALFLPVTGIPAPSPRWLERRQDRQFLVRARLRDHIEMRQAQAAMDVLARQLAADNPDTDSQKGITVLATDEVRFSPYVDGQLKPMAAIVLLLVGLVLAIACGNLATLLLVRGAARSAEVSLRLALGATRGQLVRHLLMESMMLSMAGAAVGVLVAVAGMRYLATFDLPVAISGDTNYRVLGFSVLVASLCGIGFGLWPALQVTRVDLMGALREQKGNTGGALSLSRKWFTFKNVLIVGQVTGSFLLLMGAGFCMQFLSSTQSRSVGYASTGLAVVEFDPREAGYDALRTQAVFEEVRARIAQLPGVEAVIATTGLPGDSGFDRNLLIEGYRGQTSKEKQGTSVEGRMASPGYFEIFKIPLLFGRTFDDRDVEGKPEAAIVNEAMARQYFGSPNAVGRRFRFLDGPFVEVVGVVGNVREVDNPGALPEALFYRTARQEGRGLSAIVARTSYGDDSKLLPLMLREVRTLHPELVVRGETSETRRTRDLTPYRVGMLSMTVMGTLGLALASIGLYSVVSFAVSQRISELGIRAALGARSGDLTWLVVRDVAALIVAGIAIGSAISLAGLAVSAYGRVPIIGNDPVTVLGVGVVIAVFGALAAYFPARRAVRVDPLSAIRHG